MFISKLTRIIENYDPYGLHRLNGMKVVYILFVLFSFNMLFNIRNVYFYYFYIPITAMTAEIMFERIQDKFRGFTYAMLGTCIMVFLFDLLRPYPIFFLFTAFMCSMLLYLAALHWKGFLLPLVPIILSLADYSLLYPDQSANLNMIANNALTTLLAWVIILFALILFPLSYYYRLWLRAFSFLLQEIHANLQSIYTKTPIPFSLVLGHTKQAVTFANMLPYKLPIFSILKMNLLANQLHLESCVSHSPYTRMKQKELASLLEQFNHFIAAVKKEIPYTTMGIQHPVFLKLVQAWNYVCLKI